MREYVRGVTRRRPSPPPPSAVVTVDTGTGAGAVEAGVDAAAMDAAAPVASGPVFVLVHGIGVSSRYFERLVPALSGEGRVFAVDLPGFGRATRRRPAHPLSIDDFADAVAEAMDRAGIADAVVVGHSMGTQVAVSLAVRRPDLVRGLALLGPVTDPSDRNALKSGMLLGVDTLRESPRGNLLVAADYLRCGPRWYLATLPAMLEYPIERELEAVRVPTLVVRGARDPIARTDWVAELARRSGGRAVTVPSVAHLVMHGAPWRTAALIAQVAEVAA